ncbi:MAG: cation transporter [Sphingobacteriaceae bacterium]|nr:cation transporter [Sphingobacteriaceae bacterium]
MFNAIKIFLFSTLLFAACGTPSNAVLERSLHVYGNNEMCKATIEKAALVDGVVEANWDINSKLLTVKLDTNVTTVKRILKSVASAGYDNEEYIGNDYAYQKLPEACHYERKEN